MIVCPEILSTGGMSKASAAGLLLFIFKFLSMGVWVWPGCECR